MIAVLADDHDMVRESFATTLVTNPNFKVRKVLQTDNALGAIELTRANNPALAILDLGMPGLDTFEAVSQIRHIAPHTKVLIWTGRTALDLLIRARQLKTHAYVLKGDPMDEMQYAVRTVVRGGVYTPPSLSHLLLEPGRTEKSAIGCLTPRERSILAQISKGLPMKEIADNLRISVKTAETHRNNLGRKLGHPNKAQLFAFALRHNLVDTEALAISA
jgi:DNA-binding NarL/FixJ family response regulator